MKRIVLQLLVTISLSQSIIAQAIKLPSTTNITCMTGRKIATTEIQVKWNAPGVKGREGKIWGTDIAPYDFTVLGFGSNVASPWRAGADECTNISFSTDVSIKGKTLKAGNYAFFIALYEDSCVLIFNKNVNAWGAYFYDKELDVLRVSTKQLKNQPISVERLEYAFSAQTENSVQLALNWEKWSIPFTISVNTKETTLADVKSQMSGALGFDPPSLEAAANWCLTNNVNYEEALNWINSATSPNLGGKNTFNALNTKAGLLQKMGKPTEATEAKALALKVATVLEMHGYGRSLLTEGKKEEALKIFQENHSKNNGAWPTNAGLMRGYSAIGDYVKALDYAKKALEQATDDVNKKAIKGFIALLEKGEPIK